MKHLLLIVLTFSLGSGYCQINAGTSLASGKMDKGYVKPGMQNAGSAQWQSEAEQYIKESEYHFKKDLDITKFYAVNSKQKLGFSIDPLGYKVCAIRFTDKEDNTNNWEERLS